MTATFHGEMNVRGATGIRHRLDGAEKVFARRSRDEAAEALEVGVAVRLVSSGTSVKINASGVALPNLDRGISNRAAGCREEPSAQPSDLDAATLSVSSGHVRYLLNGRVPELPRWLTEGIERVYRGADLVLDPITLGPLVWVNDTETGALVSDASRPRAPLPAPELFANDAARRSEGRHPRRVATRASTQELFVRWALVSGSPTREALWSFAARAAEGPVTEQMFASNFGFGFSELRDRLSDYLPKAVQSTFRINPGRQPVPVRFEVERATPNEIARVRGEWERLAIGHVQRRLPQVREPYIAQARRTLRRAFDAGDRDPRLLATLGLCEVDAGNPGGAREHLEQAVALGVVRPRAYYELARIRFDELRRRAPETPAYSFTEVAPILDPLRRGVTQSPPLPEAFELLGDVWGRCELAPNASELAELERGARLFPRRPEVGTSIARALARHGKATEAVAVLELVAGAAMEDPTRVAIAQLWAELPVSARPRDGGK